MNKTQWAGAAAAAVAIIAELLRAFRVYDITPEQTTALTDALVGLFAIGAFIIGAEAHKTAARVKAAGAIAVAHPAMLLPTGNAVVNWTTPMTASPSVAADVPPPAIGRGYAGGPS